MCCFVLLFAGWLTVGPELTNSNFTPEWYGSYFVNGEITTGCTERIEALRPKSPPPKGKGAPGSRGRGGMSRGSFSRGRGRGKFEYYETTFVQKLELFFVISNFT